MSVVESTEAIERFCDAMSRAASKARQLSDAQASKDWQRIAIFLDELRKKGKKIAEGRSITKHDSDRIIANRLTAMGARTDQIAGNSRLIDG